jgi:hypothetical protein
MEVQWGNKKGKYTATNMICADLAVFTEQKEQYRESRVPFVIAPLRVDVILGLPFIMGLDIVSFGDNKGFPVLEYRENGQVYALRARPTNRRWQPLTANAAHLTELRDRCAPRFSCTTSILNTDDVYTAKQWRKMIRRRIITDMFEVRVHEADAILEVNFVRTVEQKKRDILDQKRQDQHAGPTPTTADILEHIPQGHFLRNVLEKYRHTLFTEQEGMPPDRGDDNFSIRLKPGSRPVMLPLRHLSPDELQELNEQLKKLMAKGWISHSRSAWGAPVLFAPKKDGGLRCCIDYRALNKMTHKDATPLPNLAELRDRLVNKQVFTAIDIRDAYHCIMIRPEDREKTAFRTRFGHFEYNVLPFGLTNAPATFQRLTNKILGDKYDDCVISYLDDILIFSDDEAQHKQHVDAVLGTLAEHKLYVKPSKCTWAVEEVEFCGHYVGRDGLRIAPSKVEAVKERPRPTSAIEILSFMGLVNYLSAYIPNFARVALPLTNMQSGTKPWHWGDEEEQAFQELKRLCIRAPTLAFYDASKELYVFTDASGYAVGGWLAQPTDGDHPYPSPLPKRAKELDDLPRLRPITYFSKKMLDAETRYPTHEQELLAVVRCFKANRHYLIGRHFRSFTDHESLIYLQEQPHLSRRQAGWVEFLQQFDFDIEYLPGKWNNVADVLSRNPDYAPRCISCQNKVTLQAAMVDGLAVPSSSIPTDAEWLQALESDDFYLHIKAALAKPDSAHQGVARRFTLPADGFLYYHGSRRYVPDACRGAVLHHLHDEPLNGGHSGIHRTLGKLLLSYYWPRMERDVHRYITTCAACQRHKPPHAPVGFLRSLPVPDERWRQIGLDIFFPTTTSKRGKGINAQLDADASQKTSDDAVLILIDYLSGRVILLPTHKRATARELAQLFLEQAFRHTGLPHTIVSDRDPKWLGEFWQLLLNALGVKQELSTARHQQTDGKVENVIKTIKGMMKPYLNYAGSNWKELLPMLEFSYNRTPQTSTGMAPFKIDLGRIPRVPDQWLGPDPNLIAKQSERAAVEERIRDFETVSRIVQERLRAAQDTQAAYYDRRKKSETYRTGDKVLLSRDGINIRHISARNQKLTEQWIGPFTIKGKGPNPDTYELELSKELTELHPIFHVSILKRWNNPESDKHRSSEAPPAPNEAGEYQVEKILDTRWYRNTEQFLVKWAGYDNTYNTWEPWIHVKDTRGMDEWLKEHRRLPRKKGVKRKRNRLS